MFNYLCRRWFELSGWTVINVLPEKIAGAAPQKFVIIGAPHTSNWDFILGMGALAIMRLPVKFTIKKEWMFFPVGGLLRRMGAIPIDRTPEKGSKPKNMVTLMAELLAESEEDLVIVVTPEATRSRREKWKAGFYHVAKQANVPILLGFIDYQRKECGVKEICYPGADMDKDMRQIMAFYQTTHPKYPELFSVDQSYVD